jgi:hypothetical protein
MRLKVRVLWATPHAEVPQHAASKHALHDSSYNQHFAARTAFNSSRKR